MMNHPVDPLIPAERYVLFGTFENLVAPGSYFIRVVSVFPQHQGRGVGGRLLSLAHSQAQEKGFTELGLHVFEQNERAVEFYRRAGFRPKGRNPVVEHELLHFSGYMLLMTCPV
jgi:ribosomal protein S18 acetylase RimI-like enzyme